MSSINKKAHMTLERRLLDYSEAKDGLYYRYLVVALAKYSYSPYVMYPYLSQATRIFDV